MLLRIQDRPSLPAAQGDVELEFAFLIPGDLELPTGGYAYDRAVLRHVREAGLRAIQVNLPGAFPHPSEEDLEDCLAIIQGLPKGCLLLIDNLAYGAMPEAMIRQFERPVVALCHHPLALDGAPTPGVAEALYERERAALALANHVIVTAPRTAKILAGDYDVPAGKITLASPGAGRKGRAQGSNGPRLEVLAVGSLVPRKGYDRLITALAMLEQRNWRLSIVGAALAPDCAADLDGRIEALGLQEHVRLLGAVNEKALESLYDHADIFVAPALFEPHGATLAEALSIGLPIVATLTARTGDLIPEGAGLKVPPGDIEALSRALGQLVGQRELRRTLGDAAYAAGQRLGGWDDTAATICAALRAVTTP